MKEPLAIELPHEIRCLLELMAEAGILGGTAEEVSAYLITRELDDMLRSGCVKLGGDEKPAAVEPHCPHGFDDIFLCSECAPF